MRRRPEKSAVSVLDAARMCMRILTVILRQYSSVLEPWTLIRGVRPKGHIWMSHKAPWYEVRDDLPRFDEGPDKR